MSFPSASPILQPAQLSVKKRKRETITDTPTEIDSRPFAVRPANDDPFAKTTNLTPICVLQRSQLPLACLDVAGSGSRLFAAHVQALESLHESGIAGNLLVTEQKEEGRLYIVERAAKRVYALCRLGDWITKETLGRLAQADSKEPARNVKRRITQEGTSPWWKVAAVEMPKELPQDKRQTTGLLRLAMQPLETKPVPQLLPNDMTQRPDALEGNAGTLTLDSHVAENQSADAAPQDPLEELAKQYLDALYLHRTSLAYFVKGPMSRVRSTFTSGIDTPSQSPDLIEFLRNSILPTSAMDKKYKDGIPALIKDLPLVTPSPAKPRRKKKFKPKRDRSGLFTNEQEYLEKWWRSEETSGSMTSPENTETALRRRVPGLRIRETYLQIIVILETIYLEKMSKRAAATTEPSAPVAESQNAERQDAESQATPGATKRKGKKLLDLLSLLETLLDRLNIWHDLEAPPPAKSLSGEKDGNCNEPSNELRDFCIEIIVPFYNSRLADEAELVNVKLGGPLQRKAKPEKKRSTSFRSKPGEPAPRSRSEKQPEKRPRAALSRVATETHSKGARPVPGLNRSATDPTLIKREHSEPALSSIPAAKPQTRPARVSALSSFTSKHREVDLTEKGAQAAERLRRKKETEAQVREAIDNARKPNRPMATKEVAARADERFAQSLSNKPSRSKHHPPPHQQQPSVHVAATPKRATTKQPPFANQFIPAPTSTHSSNHSVIPSSSVRPRPAAPQRIDSTPAVPQTSHRDTANARRASGVEETPSRGSSSKFAFVSPSKPPPIGFPAALCESPTSRRGGAASHIIAATPVKMVGRKVSFGVAGETPVAAMGDLRESGKKMFSTASAGVAVEATPVKKSNGGGGVYGLYDDGEENDQRVKSIYDAWNDDDDYEELA